MNTSPQPRKLPVNSSLEHLQKQAKRRSKQTPDLPLAAAQHQLAKEYGCKSWAELARIVASMSRRHDQLADSGDRYEALPKAARYEGIDEVRRLLRDEPFTQHNLDQALAHALWYGGGPARTWEARKAMADLLLDHGADPDGQYGSGGYGPIVFGTAECVVPDALQYLIDAGADVSGPPIQTKYGQQCVMSHLLGTYIRGRNREKHRCLEILLEHGAHVPAELTPPLLALHRGDAAVLNTQLARHPALANTRLANQPYGNIALHGASLLHAAAEFGEAECLALLLGRGADVNLPADITDGTGGQTPIFHALGCAFAGDLASLRVLAAHPGVNWTIPATFHRFGKKVGPITATAFADQTARNADAHYRAQADRVIQLLHEMQQ